jgi:hypothetical protein
MVLPEGRQPLTDDDMIILLHNMARSFTGEDAIPLRQTADRFSELAKAAKIAQHKAQQG